MLNSNNMYGCKRYICPTLRDYNIKCKNIDFSLLDKLFDDNN